MTSDPKSVVFQFLGYMASGDIADIEKAGAMFAEDAEFWIIGNLPMSGMVRGREAIMERRFRPGAKLTVPGSKRLQIGMSVTEGEYVACEWKSQRKVVDGPDYHNEFFGLFQVRNGEIKLLREYMDTLAVKESRWRETQENLR